MSIPESAIVLRGELDLQRGRDLASTLSQAVGNVAEDVSLDLREVTFIDSTTLGMLVRSAQQLVNQGRRLQLWVVPGAVTELLAHSGVSDMFDVRSAV